MFSVECEKCKSEIPLGMTECPVCAAKAAAGEPEVTQTMQAPAAPPQAAMATDAMGAQVAAMPRAAYRVPQPRAAMPAWLVMVGVAVLMGLVLALGYLVLLPKLRNGRAATPAAAPPAVAMETPQQQPAATPVAPAGGRFGKYVEVVGIRIIEENKKSIVRFLVVNHAAAELTDVNGMVEIRPAQGGAMVGRVEVKIPSMEPYESREFSASLNTSLRAYEIPDWQFLRGQFVE